MAKPTGLKLYGQMEEAARTGEMVVIQIDADTGRAFIRTIDQKDLPPTRIPFDWDAMQREADANEERKRNG